MPKPLMHRVAQVDLKGGFEVLGGRIQISSLEEITAEADQGGGVAGIAFRISTILLLGVIEAAILAEFRQGPIALVQVRVPLQSGAIVLDQDRELGRRAS